MSVQTLPPYDSREHGGVFPFLIFVELTLLALLLLSNVIDWQSRESTIREFQSRRPQILSRIHGALGSGDLSTIEWLDEKYSKSVEDPEFRRQLANARAQLQATESRKELVAGRILDLARQNEEHNGRIAR